MRYRWIFIVCLFFGGQCVIAQENPRPQGRVLFRDDFGGNNVNDPIHYTGSHPNIINYTNWTEGPMKEGMYIITKKGLEPGDWHPQDDYTYPNDYTRGYFLEIDGRGVNDPFYVVKLNDLYADMELRFSARVVNVNLTDKNIVCQACNL